MATVACVTSAQFCRVRATRLAMDGTAIHSATAAWVGDTGISIDIAPEIMQGTDTETINGCGCICATLKTPDRFKRWNLTLELCGLNPNQIELFTGAPLLTGLPATGVAPGVGTDIIGNAWQDQLGCAYDPNGFALDVWTKAWVEDSQLVSPTRCVIPTL